MTKEELLGKVELGMSRADVIQALGPPDHVGATSRKHKSPSILKYGDIELWFEQPQSGVLHTIWDEHCEVILKTRH